MTVHATLEQLSSYLDRELAERERVGLEEHLDDCASCRGRLDGLRSVVSRLERLEQQAPPSDLVFLVERRVAAEAGRGGLQARVEETIKTFLIQPSLTPIFGLVVALALILYLFSFGVARQQQRGTRLVVPLNGAALELESRTVDGRAFERLDDIWIERGLDAAAPVEVLEIDGAPPAELAPFTSLGPRVRLLHEGRVVELVAAASDETTTD